MPHEEERIRVLEAQVSELTDSVTRLTAAFLSLTDHLAQIHQEGSYPSFTNMQVSATAIAVSFGRVVPIYSPTSPLRPLSCDNSRGMWMPFVPPPQLQVSRLVPIAGPTTEPRSAWDHLTEDPIGQPTTR